MRRRRAACIGPRIPARSSLAPSEARIGPGASRRDSLEVCTAPRTRTAGCAADWRRGIGYPPSGRVALATPTVSAWRSAVASLPHRAAAPEVRKYKMNSNASGGGCEGMTRLRRTACHIARHIEPNCPAQNLRDSGDLARRHRPRRSGTADAIPIVRGDVLDRHRSMATGALIGRSRSLGDSGVDLKKALSPIRIGTPPSRNPRDTRTTKSPDQGGRGIFRCRRRGPKTRRRLLRRRRAARRRSPGRRHRRTNA